MTKGPVGLARTRAFGLAGMCLAMASGIPAHAATHTAPGKYGYYEVREGAFTFWWWFPRHEASDRASHSPLVLWLQGGPGASGTGFGNFEEVGPFQKGWKPRSHPWTEHADLLFVDNPVGTGFSYVANDSCYARNDSMIAADLLSFLRQYLDEHDAHSQPLYIFSESYGGKMCSAFAQAILEEQRLGRLNVNLRGVVLGDSWISALDYVRTWPAFLKAWSLLDDYQIGQLAPLIEFTQDAVASGNLTGATALWGMVEERIGNLTDNVDWYNALLHNIPDTMASSVWLGDAAPSKGLGARHLRRHHLDPLTTFMRGDVTKRLGIIPKHVRWGANASEVFSQLAGDFMVDTIGAVDALLDSGLPVTIYNGQLDLICSTLGLEAWLPKLRWAGLRPFQATPPEALYAAGKRQTTGFRRRHANLTLYIILGAGHMVPADQPVAALDMLRRIVGSDEDAWSA